MLERNKRKSSTNELYFFLSRAQSSKAPAKMFLLRQATQAAEPSARRRKRSSRSSKLRFNGQWPVQEVQGSRAAVQDAAELRFKVLSPLRYKSVPKEPSEKCTEARFKGFLQFFSKKIPATISSDSAGGRQIFIPSAVVQGRYPLISTFQLVTDSLKRTLLICQIPTF